MAVTITTSNRFNLCVVCVPMNIGVYSELKRYKMVDVRTVYSDTQDKSPNASFVVVVVLQRKTIAYQMKVNIQITKQYNISTTTCTQALLTELLLQRCKASGLRASSSFCKSKRLFGNFVVSLPFGNATSIHFKWILGRGLIPIGAYFA